MARLAYFAVGVLRLTFSGVVAISTIMTSPSTLPTGPARALSALAGIATARAIENQAYVAGCNRVGSEVATAAIIAVTAG